MLTVTNAQIKAFAAKARDDADWINKLFQKSSVHSLLEKGDLAFSYHPEVARGRLGKAYKDGTVEWATKGAVRQLVELLRRLRHLHRSHEGRPLLLPKAFHDLRHLLHRRWSHEG